jgi:hypothetical protein
MFMTLLLEGRKRGKISINLTFKAFKAPSGKSPVLQLATENLPFLF